MKEFNEISSVSYSNFSNHSFFEDIFSLLTSSIFSEDFDISFLGGEKISVNTAVSIALYFDNFSRYKEYSTLFVIFAKNSLNLSLNMVLRVKRK